MRDFEITQSKTLDLEASMEFAKLLIEKSLDKQLIMASIPVDTITYMQNENHLSRMGCKAFNASNLEQLVPWLQERNGKCGVYWHVNDMRRLDEAGNPLAFTSKASKRDVHKMRYLHIDIDPEIGETPEQARTRALAILEAPPNEIPRPTFVVSSGGGIQAFWELEEPVAINGDLDTCEEMERYNLQLGQELGGDHCQNLDRIMRWVGTLNVPNRKKSNDGRCVQMAEMVWNEPENVYSIDKFKKAPKLAERDTTQRNNARIQESGVKLEISGNVQPISNLGELKNKANAPIQLDVEFLDLIQSGYRPADINVNRNRTYQGHAFESRSEALFAVLRHLITAGVTDEDMYSIITDQSFGISESVREKRGAMSKYAKRQIRRAKVFHHDTTVGQMNDKHAVLVESGGRTVILTETVDHKGRKDIEIQKVEDLKIRYKNRAHITVDQQGNAHEACRVEHWLKSRYRREYKNTVFSPETDIAGFYNLYQGLAFQPEANKSCALYMKHVFKNICCNNQKHFDYLLDWMARTVQKPATRSEVAIVLQGEKGTGKTIFADAFGKLFGRHYLCVSDAEHLTGRFNSHLEDALVVFSDEAFFAKNLKHQSTLKTLITGKTMPIEPKYQALRIVDNYVHLIMASNSAHVVPAELDERRFFCLVVGNKDKRNVKVFGAIEHEMENGGHEALLHILLTRDISGFNIWDMPETQALRDQKLIGMRTEEKFWFQCLSEGKQREHDSEWYETMPTEDLHNYYLLFCEVQKINRVLTRNEFFKWLEYSMLPEGYGTRTKARVKTAGSSNNNPRSVMLVPDLKQSRDFFSQKYTGGIDWDSVDEVEETKTAQQDLI